MMEITYFAPTVSIAGKDGGATHVYEVVRRLADNNKVHLVTEGIAEGLNVEFLDVSSRFRLLKYFKSLLVGVRPVLKSDLVYERTDVIGAGSLLSMLFGKPLVLETNSIVLEERIRNNLIRWMLNKWLSLRYRKAKRIVSTLKSLVPDEFKSKVFETEWGVDIQRFNPEVDGTSIRKELKLEKKKIVLFSGASGPWHGLKDLLDAVPFVRKEQPDAEFICIGRITDREVLEKAGSTEGIRILGPVKYEEVPSYLACADVLVAPFNPEFFPYLKEYGFYWSPLKIFEYMAMGKPIVSTKTVSRIIEDKKEGLLVEPGNVKSFAKAIIHVLENPSESKGMGINARKKAEKEYSWDSHVSNLLTVIKG